MIVQLVGRGFCCMRDHCVFVCLRGRERSAIIVMRSHCFLRSIGGGFVWDEWNNGLVIGAFEGRKLSLGSSKNPTVLSVGG